MKHVYFLLAAAFVFPHSSAQAAQKFFQGYRFQAYVVGSSISEGGINRSINPDSNFIQVGEGQEYSIEVRNPLPVRVAATVTVDGLNTIDGKRTSSSDGQKWLIDPYSSITIRGWQTSDDNSRKFFFSRRSASYAKWKELRDRRDYTANLGIIGVAYFWNSAEMSQETTLPQPFESEQGLSDRKFGSSAAPSKSGSMRLEERAGTGMGRSEWNQVRHVSFYYDTGMYSGSDALTIRYEFGPKFPQPMPFEDSPVTYRYRGSYAPEMY